MNYRLQNRCAFVTNHDFVLQREVDIHTLIHKECLIV